MEFNEFNENFPRVFPSKIPFNYFQFDCRLWPFCWRIFEQIISYIPNSKFNGPNQFRHKKVSTTWMTHCGCVAVCEVNKVTNSVFPLNHMESAPRPHHHHYLSMCVSRLSERLRCFRFGSREKLPGAMVEIFLPLRVRYLTWGWWPDFPACILYKSVEMVIVTCSRRWSLGSWRSGRGLTK